MAEEMHIDESKMADEAHVSDCTMEEDDISDTGNLIEPDLNENIDTLQIFEKEELPSLPCEVWLRILRQVPSKDIAAVSRVSKFFADLTNDPRLWKELKIRVPKLLRNEKYFNEKICEYKWLEALELEGMDGSGAAIPEQFFINLSLTAPRLKKLRVQECVVEQSYINHLATGCPHLTSLELMWCQLVGTGLKLFVFKNLRVFNMIDCSFKRQ